MHNKVQKALALVSGCASPARDARKKTRERHKRDVWLISEALYDFVTQ